MDAEDGDYFNDVYKYDIATSMWGSVPSWAACMSCMRVQRVSVNGRYTLWEKPPRREQTTVSFFFETRFLFLADLMDITGRKIREAAAFFECSCWPHLPGSMTSENCI